MSSTGRIDRPGGASALQRFGANIAAGAAALVRPRRGPPSAFPARSRLVIGALLAILAVAVAMLLLDAWSAGRVRELPWLVIVFFNNITDFGLSGWFLYPTGVALLVIAAIDATGGSPALRGPLAALAVRLGFVFAAIAVPGLFVALIKRLIGRARPFIDGSDTWAYLPFAWRPDYASFPSGHATTAFAAAIAIGALWPRARPVMWTYAVLIALSRVVVVAHHPSDVIAGAVIGACGALLVRNWFAARRLGFVIGPDGGVRKLPGPSLKRLKAVARRRA
ncbi:MAG TPA: phosphatase PAP2 family protein [Candidatus Limnocylindrales bacterium]|jgi:undecaprenyl-diphosphatase